MSNKPSDGSPVSKKTYKREFAVVLFLWFAYIVEVKDVEYAKFLVWPVFTVVAGAFGFDQYSKLQQSRDEAAVGGRP